MLLKRLRRPPTIQFEYEKFLKLDTISYIPDPCKGCSNHPSNGGSGICHCILGNQIIY